jgi:hypothetical protein
MTWRWPSSAETCRRYCQRNKRNFYNSWVFDGPNSPLFMHKNTTWMVNVNSVEYLTFSVTPHPSRRTPCTVYKDSIKCVHWALHSTLRRQSVCSRTVNSTIGVVHATRNRPLPRPFWQPVCSKPSPGARMSEVPSRDPPTSLSSPLTQTINAHGRIVCGSEIITLIRGAQILGRSRSHLKIPGARTATRWQNLHSCYRAS